ncbi:MAG: hypothetical protein JO121_16720 [Deltaproteobacteria bacterium]|jgi:hypothetical protein|nr:hypothetical protein [Deltaproteobacteria bacterium]
MKTSLRAMAAALLLILGDRACAQSIISKTQVTWFSPSVPSGPIQEGSCWTRSIAADRPGAWRCIVGNGIHDPCFQVAPIENEVICDANPVLGKSGFVMKLTTPLPLVTTPPTASASPWILELKDGSVCERFTGTRPAVNNQPAVWSCIKPGVPPSPRTNSLVTKVHPGKLWTAERYAESAVAMGNSMSESRRVEAQIVPVARVWQ